MTKDQTDPEKTSVLIVQALEEFGPLYRSFVGSHLPKGLSEARLRAMATLASQPEMTISELRQSIGGTAQNATGLVDALEREGYVMRRPHETDRRKTMISLSESARSEISAQRREHRFEVASLFESLSEEDQCTLLSTINRVVLKLKDTG